MDIHGQREILFLTGSNHAVFFRLNRECLDHGLVVVVQRCLDLAYLLIMARIVSEPAIDTELAIGVVFVEIRQY